MSKFAVFKNGFTYVEFISDGIYLSYLRNDILERDLQMKVALCRIQKYSTLASRLSVCQLQSCESIQWKRRPIVTLYHNKAYKDFNVTQVDLLLDFTYKIEYFTLNFQQTICPFFVVLHVSHYDDDLACL